MMENLKALRWENGYLILLDQRKLPEKITYVRCGNLNAAIEAIRNLTVRGAPAIGVSAAYAMVLAAKDIKGIAADKEDFFKRMKEAGKAVKNTRPTAVNLIWAVDEMLKIAGEGSMEDMYIRLLSRGKNIEQEDKHVCTNISIEGSKLFKGKKKYNILTHCNTGALATAGVGTALGIIYRLHEEGRIRCVYVDETRPVLQGSRLTASELREAGVPCRLITDSMAAAVLRDKQIDAVIVGADRIVKNGDVANKIGTYGLAVLSDAHRVPFYVAAPFSTFDFSLSSGADIQIEERPADEVRKMGDIWTAPKDIPVMNPSFDVTPYRLISAIITEKGIIRAPYEEHISQYERSLP